MPNGPLGPIDFYGYSCYVIDTGATERSIRCTSRMDKACLSK